MLSKYGEALKDMNRKAEKGELIACPVEHGAIKPDEKLDTSKTLTEKEGKVLNYLRHFNEFVKPTELAMEIFGKPYCSASSFASPICKKLVAKGLIERNRQGHYKAL